MASKPLAHLEWSGDEEELVQDCQSSKVGLRCVISR
jgi:hypothetical protein